MEDSFAGALRSAQLIDLQDGSSLQLPDTEQLVAVGLTVDDRLSFTVNPLDDDLVLTLCHVQRQEDGHWFFPSVFLPCLLNETRAEGESLLSQGSTISVGDREVRYSIPLESRLRMESESKKSSGPPPKPRRTSLNLDAAPLVKQPMSPIEEETPDVAPTVSTDKDLIQHLSSPQEVAQLACSYVCHQVALYTDLLLSSEELDFLFKAILAAGEPCCVQLREFVTRYSDAQETGNTGEIWPLHGPVIYLLKELLKENLDSVRYATMWIKLLATFANFSPNLPALIQHQVAPVILGTMAVHSQAAALQQYACTVLTQLATYTPPVGQKGPVREGGVDLVMFAMTNHVHETLVLRPALRTLANLTNTYSALANEALNLGSYSEGLLDETHTVVLQEVERSMGILDFIEEHALPVVMETMEHHLRDLAIQTEGRRLLAFFVDEEIKITRKKSVDMMTRGKSKVRFQLDPNDPTWIVATDHDSTDTTDDEEEEAMRRLSTVSLLSLDSAPLVGRLQVRDPIPEDSDGQEQNDSSSMGDEYPRRKLGMAHGTGGGSRVAAGVSPIVFEFEPWDDEKPVMRASATVGIKRIEDLIAEDSDEEIIGPLPPLSTSQLPSGETSLMDELAEIGAGPGMYAEVDMEDQSTVVPADNNSEYPKRIKQIQVASPQTEPIYAEVNKTRKTVSNEGTDELDDALPLMAAGKLVQFTTPTPPQLPHVEDSTTGPEPIYAEIQDVPSTETVANTNTTGDNKESTLKRGMKKFLTPGRMFNKMKQKLKFKELRTKEDQLLESAKGGADTDKVSDNGGDDASVSKGTETAVVDNTEEVCIIAGVTIDASVTDDVTDDVTVHADSSNMNSESTSVPEVVPNQVSGDIEPADTKAPPLFVQPEEPKVKGSKNTVVNLIDRWKRKEKTPSSEKGAVKKQALRKQWRPFQQMDSSKTEEQATVVVQPSHEAANHEGELMINGGSVIPNSNINESMTSNNMPLTKNDILTEEPDSSSENTRLEYLASKSHRRTLGSLAMLPDVERFLTSARPSIADAGELATWTSCYNAMSGEDVQDLDLEAEQAVRVNKTKWKSVVAEMKHKVKTNSFPFTLRTGEGDPSVRTDSESAQFMSQQLTNNYGGKTAPPLAIQRRVSRQYNLPNALSFPELRSPEYRDRNILAAKALITSHVLEVWHTSPSLASAVLGARTSDCLSVSGVAPDIILSIRDDFNLQLPINKGHLEFSSSLMDILIGFPSGDETRMELLDLLQELLSVSAHPYHQKVAALCGRALLTDSLPDLTTNATGAAILQELLDCTERRLSEVDRTSWHGHQEALSTFRDRLNVWLQQEVWL